MSFQHYFVKLQCVSAVDGLEYEGATAGCVEIAGTARNHSVPSNPYLSIGPMLAMTELSEAIRRREQPVLAVSPTISDAAVKGPAAKFMRELGHRPHCLSLAEFYRGLNDYIVINRCDSQCTPDIRLLGIEPNLSDIMTRDFHDRCRPARECRAVRGH